MYGLDFKKITLEEFYEYLKQRRLFETHQVLKKDYEIHLANLKKLGYHNLDELYYDIRTNKKVEIFSEKNQYDLEYVTILRRHIMSLVSKPRKIVDFQMMRSEIKEYLLDKGIKDTKQLYDQIHTIECDNMKYLHAICEITQMRYLHPNFFDGIYFAGYHSMEDMSKSSVEDMSRKVSDSVKKHNLSKIKLGLKDSEYLIEDAKLYIKWLAL